MWDVKGEAMRTEDAIRETVVAEMREEIKGGLAQLEDKHRGMFARMYGTDDGKRSVEDALAMTMSDIVDAMPEERLSRAMEQIERTIQKVKEDGHA